MFALHRTDTAPATDPTECNPHPNSGSRGYRSIPRRNETLLYIPSPSPTNIQSWKLLALDSGQAPSHTDQTVTCNDEVRQLSLVTKYQNFNFKPISQSQI